MHSRMPAFSPRRLHLFTLGALFAIGGLYFTIAALRSLSPLDGCRCDTNFRTEMMSLGTQCYVFFLKTSRVPTNAEGFSVLIDPPPGVPRLADVIFPDPFGRPFQYHRSEKGPPGFVILSLGPDPNDPTDDVTYERTLDSYARAIESHL